MTTGISLPKKYKTIKEFRENENALYNIAIRKNWNNTDEFKSLKRLNKPVGYWTKERCAEEALKYETLIDFMNNAPAAYSSAWKNKWLRDITTHMKTKLTPEEMYRQKHVIYIYKDEINHYVYVGLTNNMYVRDKSHRDKNECDTLYRHFAKYNLEIPEIEIVYSDLTPHQAQEKEREVYYQYRDAGWNMINSEQALGSLGSSKKKWTFKRTFDEAIKYKTKKEFKEHCPAGYAAAWKYHYMKEFDWFIPPHIQIAKWNYQTTYNEAKKYKYLKDFREKSQGAYDSALKHKWLKDYTWLIRKHSLKWNIETCFEEAQKYEYLKDFKRFSLGAYKAAHKNGWIKNYIWLKRLDNKKEE